MTGPATRHDTLAFERAFDCPPALLWDAFADPAARARWGAPSPDAVILYDATDFRVGGRDLSRCGARGDPRFHVEAIYLDIQPGARIVHSERVSEGATPLSAALHTVEIFAKGERSALRLTVQLASFGGADMAGGVRQGMSAALDNLAGWTAGRH